MDDSGVGGTDGRIVFFLIKKNNNVEMRVLTWLVTTRDDMTFRLLRHQMKEDFHLQILLRHNSLLFGCEAVSN